MKPLKYELESGYIAGLKVKYPVIRTNSGKVIGMCLDEESPYLHAFVAAPEMLEALEDAIKVLAGIGDDDAHAYSVALTIHAAIAKAKGGKP